jgi:hypothetical protein
LGRKIRLKNITIILVAYVIFNLNCKKNSNGPTVEPLPVQENNSIEILFIGSSYFSYNDLTTLFENLAISSDKLVSISDQITKGYLADHASSSSTEEKINEKNWDYVILQGVGSLTAYPTYYTHHPVLPALDTLQNRIMKNCESTQMVFCLPWAFEDGMTWVPGWTDTYTDMQLKIYNNTLKWADALDFVISPVGWAWNTVLSEKNFPLHYLHMRDWNHPSLKGSYLMACVIYSTVYRESSIGINYYGGLTKTEAEYFQLVASNTVLNNLETWNIEKK